MIPVNRNPGPFAARELLERLRHLLLVMTDLICSQLEGECSPYARCTAEEFYQHWGNLVAIKKQLENELKKVDKYRDVVPDSPF